MATAIPPLTDSEQVKFDPALSLSHSGRTKTSVDPTIIVASYNIRYAAGSRLISGGLLRKVRGRSAGKREARVAQNIQTAARAFSDGKLMPRPDVIALQEADKETGRAGGHHVARELADALEFNWIHVPAGIPRGVPPKTRQWWLDFEEPIAL